MTAMFTGDPAKADRISPDPYRRKIPADGEDRTRAATFSPATFNADELTVEAVLSTFAPVVRRDSRSAYIERLDPAGLDTSTLDGAPLLDGHRQGSGRDVIGVITGHRLEGEKLIATIRLSAALDVGPIVARIREGTLRGVSVGYRISRWVDSVDPETKARVRTAAAWAIFEASAVPVPADRGATFRAKENDMPKDQIETDDRQALIQRVRAAHNLPEDWATRMEEAGDELSDDQIRQDGREAAAAARAANPPARIRTHTPAVDGTATRVARIEALACRMAGDTPSEAARPFMGEGLADAARSAVEAAGTSTRGMDRETLFRAAMHTTSDFPELLTGAGNRVLANAYQRAQSPLKQLARQRTAADFRPMSILKVGEFGKLAKVTESGEITALSTAEAKEGYSLETFGGLFSLSRKAIVNDDLGAFGRWGELMGQAAAETEAAQLLALLTANAGGGVKMADGKNLFHADHGNLAGTAVGLGDAGALSALDSARLALRTQKGLDGETPVNVVPKYLLVGPESETDAEKLLAAIYAATVADVNPFAGRLTPLVEPRITGPGWFLFGDPAVAPVLEYAYLSSAPGPQLASRDGWDVLGREYRVTLDFGCGAVDSRGAFRNAGA